MFKPPGENKSHWGFMLFLTWPFFLNLWAICSFSLWGFCRTVPLRGKPSMVPLCPRPLRLAKPSTTDREKNWWATENWILRVLEDSGPRSGCQHGPVLTRALIPLRRAPRSPPSHPSEAQPPWGRGSQPPGETEMLTPKAPLPAHPLQCHWIITCSGRFSWTIKDWFSLDFQLRAQSLPLFHSSYVCDPWSSSELPEMREMAWRPQSFNMLIEGLMTPLQRWPEIPHWPLPCQQCQPCASIQAQSLESKESNTRFQGRDKNNVDF